MSNTVAGMVMKMHSMPFTKVQRSNLDRKQAHYGLADEPCGWSRRASEVYGVDVESVSLDVHIGSVKRRRYDKTARPTV